MPNPSFVKIVTPLLPVDEEKKLFREWSEARDAGKSRRANFLFERIIVQYSPIVSKMARKMAGYKMDPEDMVAEGLAGLAKAAIEFDQERGFRFGTYARNCVRNTMFTHIAKNFSVTNPCANNKNKKLFFGLRRIINEKFKGQDGEEFTHEMAQEIAVHMDVTVDMVNMMNNYIREPHVSLNQPVSIGSGDNGTMTKQDYLESPYMHQTDYIEREQLNVLQKQLIGEALNTLDPRSRYIVEKQTLQPDGTVMTLDELGKRFSISKERARQVREKAKLDIGAFVKNRLRQMHLPIDALVND